MASSDLEIEQVVRRIVAQLAGQPSAATDAGPRGPDKTARKPAQPQRNTIDRIAVCNEHVVTIERINQCLAGARRIALRPDAIVTPAARDYLKEKGIGVGEPISNSGPGSVAGKAKLVVAPWKCDTDLAAVVSSMQRAGLDVGTISGNDLAQIVDELSQFVVADKGLAVLVTPQIAATLCLANRNNGVRAAMAANVAEVRDCIDAVGANLLAIDPRGRSIYELTRMAKSFAEAGPRGCPEIYCNKLN
jgi:pyruvate/2-oxoglutarate dehydrogenase complex dihydrolipoamide acyltransferase (E2) component